METVKIAARLIAAVLLFSGCGLILIEDWETRGPNTGNALSAPTVPTLSPPETLPGPAFDPRPSRRGEAEEALEKLYLIDLSGPGLIIAVNTDGDDILFSSEDDPFSNFYSARNNMVTDRYNLRLTVMSMATDDMRSSLKASVKSGADGDYYSDVIELPAAVAGEFAISGLLMNLRKLPYYNLPSEGMAACGSYGTYCFFDLSETTRSWSLRPVLYMNTSMAARDTVSEVTKAARNGSFDFDCMLKAVKDSELPDGAYGISAEYGDIGCSVMGELAAVRSGLSLTSVAGGYPAVTYVTGDTAAQLSDLIALLMKNVYVPSVSEPTDTGVAAQSSSASPFDCFCESRSLFHVGRLRDIAGSLKDRKVRWTALPLPKVSASQDSVYTLASPGKSVLCAPANNKRTEQTGIFLSASAAASGNWIGDDYANFCLNEGYFRDNDSYFTLLSFIDEPEYFDFSYIFGSQVANLDAATYAALRKCASEGTPLSESSVPLITKLNAALKKLKFPG
ncbi:MAG: hypothetical protein MJ137_01495 [Clostridia bacterium]|nr:hypothetical protein [Clostridia bacterium]